MGTKSYLGLSFAFACLLISPCSASAQPDSGILDRLRTLPVQAQAFEGELEWTSIMVGAGVDLLKLELMSGKSAYAALHEGKEINDLPYGAIEWHQFTSTPLVQRSKTAWYIASDALPIDKSRANSLSNEVEVLASDWDSASSISPGRFQFGNKKTDTATSAGLQIVSVRKDETVQEWVSPEESLEPLLRAFPNPLRWPQSPDILNSVLERGSWSSASSGKSEVKQLVEGTTYTIQLNDKALPEKTKGEKIVKGGWTRVITAEYTGWKQIGRYWVPETVMVDFSLVTESLSAPISKQFIVLNKLDTPAPS